MKPPGKQSGAMPSTTRTGTTARHMQRSARSRSAAREPPSTAPHASDRPRRASQHQFAGLSNQSTLKVIVRRAPAPRLPQLPRDLARKEWLPAARTADLTTPGTAAAGITPRPRLLETCSISPWSPGEGMRGKRHRIDAHPHRSLHTQDGQRKDRGRAFQSAAPQQAAHIALAVRSPQQETPPSP